MDTNDTVTKKHCNRTHKKQNFKVKPVTWKGKGKKAAVQKSNKMHKTLKN